MVTNPVNCSWLPERGPSVYHLDRRRWGEHATHALAIDSVLQNGGPTYWIDVKWYPRTRPLVRLAPSERLHRGIVRCHCFRAWQHRELLTSLHHRVGNASLVVLPAVDAVYRSTSPDGTPADTPLDRALTACVRLVRDQDIPVVVTTVEADEFTAQVEAIADRPITFEGLPSGPEIDRSDVAGRGHDRPELSMPAPVTYWATVLAERAAHRSAMVSNVESSRG